MPLVRQMEVLRMTVLSSIQSAEDRILVIQPADIAPLKEVNGSNQAVVTRGNPFHLRNRISQRR